jgi:hypothetical protein
VSLTPILAAALLKLPLPLGEKLAEQVQGHSGDLDVVQMATLDLDRLHKEWEVPEAGVSLTTDNAAVRGRPIFTFLLISGCHAAADGNCNVTVDFEILDPRGKSYGRNSGAPAWPHPPLPIGTYILSEVFVGLRVEPGETLGQYKVLATATDHVAGSVVHTSGTLNISEAPKMRR